MGLAIYRKGQGKLTRGTSAVCLGLLLLLGAYQLYQFTVGYQWANAPMGGFVIPIVEQPFNVAFLASAMVLVGGGFGLFAWLNRKSSVDLLIDTETELKKVTWPGWPETVNSSVIVIIAVIVIGFYLSLIDFLLGRFFGMIL